MALLVAVLCPVGVAWAHDSNGEGHHAEEASTASENVDLVLVSGEAPVLVLTQGRTYRVTIHSSRSIEMHLHGYDLTARAAPGVSALFVFNAEHTGRFPIETHGESDLLGRGSQPVGFIEIRRRPDQ
ncbi:MAG: hypothetical protein CVT80_06920 [Alphaproteobacteria bacterium HGW-Alphaproteobacteria-2]|nr:MAG: hypothetical protein CVT80_06920 [Alphaproteobacteria bacterium HGW-Alphaproteobacteria-2]